MQKTKKRILAYHYSRGKRTFQVVARIKGGPGTLSRLLDKMREQLDFVTDLAFNEDEKSAIFSGFAAPLSDKVTVKTIETALKSLPNVIESEVTESEEGLLVDTFHSGLEVDDGYSFVLFPVGALSRTFGEIISLMGSGGETILYNEGLTLGRINARAFAKTLGADVQRKLFPYAAKVYGALGWGNASVREGGKDGSLTIRVDDCFECTSKRVSREGCNFVRGHMVGTVSTAFGGEYCAEETRCRFKGGRYCEFVLKAT